MANIISVKSKKSNSYKIYIGSYLQSLDSILEQYLIPNNNNIVIYDEKLKISYLPLIENALNKLGGKFLSVSATPGDSHKNFTQIEALINQILAFNVTRKSTIIVLGGGSVGDLGGFIASILLRGINYIHIPTTLLAATDSAIGGKTAISHSQGKNLIGSFYNPTAVIIDPSTLQTLPKRELTAGFAEVIKYGLVRDKKFFSYLQRNYNLLDKKDEAFLNYIISKSCNIKRDIVKKDEQETQNLRVILNYGHTFGHALEQLNNYQPNLLHGEAVAIGMCMAGKFGLLRGYLSLPEVRNIIHILQELNLPTSPSVLAEKYSPQKLLTCMQQDKKNYNGYLNLVLLKAIGRAELFTNIKPDSILNFLTREY